MNLPEPFISDPIKGRLFFTPTLKHSSGALRGLCFTLPQGQGCASQKEVWSFLLLSVSLLSEQLRQSLTGPLGRVHKVTRFNGHWSWGQEAPVM